MQKISKEPNSYPHCYINLLINCQVEARKNLNMNNFVAWSNAFGGFYFCCANHHQNFFLLFFFNKRILSYRKTRLAGALSTYHSFSFQWIHVTYILVKGAHTLRKMLSLIHTYMRYIEKEITIYDKIVLSQSQYFVVNYCQFVYQLTTKEKN